jgi:hypothetical protein
MSEHLISFGSNVVALDYDLERRMEEWHALRKVMVRSMPEAFTRDEWAYLVTFLDHSKLMQPFQISFGSRGEGRPQALFRPRGPIAIWLPSNVSLLGPLVLILCCFTGAPIRVKAGSRSTDLCQAFVSYALDHLAAGELADYLRQRVAIKRFDREDERNAAMALAADVRIAFGSDRATREIHGLPHPVHSVGISFSDHRSEAWVDMASMNDESIVTLIKVFSIYGQAGCTSPRRVVIIDGDMQDCIALRARMISLWPKQTVPMHIASRNILDWQLAAAEGWDAVLVPRSSAVLGLGPVEKEGTTGPMSLTIAAATAQEAAARLPGNIQTVGHCLVDSTAPQLLALIAQTAIKRWVPIGEMHHFGAVWDGMNFWRLLFEETVIQS